MKNLFQLYTVIFICLIWTGCSENELVKSENLTSFNNMRLVVDVEQSLSRSTVDATGTYYWTKGDEIGVYGAETVNARFSIEDQTMDGAYFKGEMLTKDEKPEFALYPYSENLVISNDSVYLEFPETRYMTHNDPTPMIGFYENGKMKFYHTGGLLCVRLIGLDREKAYSLELKAYGGNTPYLSGKAYIGERKPGAVYTISEGSYTSVLKIYKSTDVNWGEGANVFYFPLQVGHYEKLEFSVKTEDGESLFTRSISNLDVNRGDMTLMPVTNVSDDKFVYEMPQEYLEGTKLAAGFITSDMFFIGVDTLGGDKTQYVFTNLNQIKNEEQSFMYITLNKDNSLSEIIINDNGLFFEKNEDGTYNMLCLVEGQAEEYTNIQLNHESKSRGVTTTSSIYYEQISTQASWLSTIYGLPGLAKNFVSIGSTVLGLPITSIIPNDYARLVLGVAASIIAGVAMLATLPATFTAGSVFIIAGAVINLVLGFIGAGEVVKMRYYMELFNLVCGETRPITLTPELIDENTFRYGYKIVGYKQNNDDWYTKLLKKWFVPVCGIIRQPWSREHNEEPTLHIEEDHLEKAHRLDDLNVMEFWNEDYYSTEFDEYLKSFIAFEGRTSVANYGNVQKLSFDASIQDVDVWYNFYLDGVYHFAFKVTCQSESNFAPFWLNFYRSGNLIDSKKWSNEVNVVEFECEIDENKMNFETMTAIEPMGIGISCLPNEKTNLLAQKVIELKYTRVPTLKIDSVHIGETRKYESRAAVGEHYETDVKVFVKYTGGGAIKSIKMKGSNGDVWDSKRGIIFDEYDSYEIKATLKYSKDVPPATLQPIGNTKQQKSLVGTNRVQFDGVPINSYTISK